MGPQKRWESIGVRLGHPVCMDSLNGAQQQKAVVVELGRQASKQTGSLSPPVVPGREAELQVVLDEKSGRAVWIALFNPQGVTASEMQRFPWKRYLVVAEAAARQLASPTVGGSGQLDLDELLWAAASGKPVSKLKPGITKRPGRAGHPDEHYKAVAERYRRLVRVEGSTRPTATIGEECHVSRNTAADWVSTCRKRGYLPPARRGRAG